MHRTSRAPSWLARACLLALIVLPVAALPAEKPAAEKPAAEKPAADKKGAARSATAATSTDSVSYSAGVSVGEGLHRAGITTEIDLAAFTHGLKDALAGKTTTPEDRERLSSFMADLRNTIGARNKDAARDFLARNGKEAGVVTTASGLQYKVIEPGDLAAASPAASDEVTVQYRGKLLDGTEFDSSYSHGAPAKFPVNGVIKGWQEALQLMKPGAKWQLFVPPGLAYDLNSRPPIPPGSLLLFDVELVSAAATGAASPPAVAPATAPAATKAPVTKLPK